MDRRPPRGRGTRAASPGRAARRAPAGDPPPGAAASAGQTGIWDGAPAPPGPWLEDPPPRRLYRRRETRRLRREGLLTGSCGPHPSGGDPEALSEELRAIAKGS